MPSFWKKKQFWGSLIAIILLGYCLKDIRLEDVRRLYERVNFYYLIPALVMEFALIIFKAVRWKTIVEKVKRIKFFRVLFLFSAGQVLNIIMPALTGQVGRLLLFSRKENLSKSYVFSTIVIEILFDSISMFLFIFALSITSFVIPPEYRPASLIIGIATAVLIILLYLILHFQEGIGRIGRKVMRGRWPGLYITLKKFSNSFTKGIELLRSSQYFFRTLLLSVGSWAAHAAVVYFLFKAFGFELPFIAAIVVMVINTVALMIPITPGNAGTFELAVVAALLAFRINKSDAVLFALALHILDMIPIFVMGFLFLHSERMSIKELEDAGGKGQFMEQMEEAGLLGKEDKST
jgi:glycosyltransferase AglD